MLKEIRAILVGEGFDGIDRLIDLVSNLDGWLSGGGRLPDDWEVKR